MFHMMNCNAPAYRNGMSLWGFPPRPLQPMPPASSPESNWSCELLTSPRQCHISSQTWPSPALVPPSVEPSAETAHCVS